MAFGSHCSLIWFWGFGDCFRTTDYDTVWAEQLDYPEIKHNEDKPRFPAQLQARPRRMFTVWRFCASLLSSLVPQPFLASNAACKPIKTGCPRVAHEVRE
jgi:hypothetical protein